jgi:hypothetical protein
MPLNTLYDTIYLKYNATLISISNIVIPTIEIPFLESLTSV